MFASLRRSLTPRSTSFRSLTLPTNIIASIPSPSLVSFSSASRLTSSFASSLLLPHHRFFSSSPLNNNNNDVHTLNNSNVNVASPTLANSPRSVIIRLLENIGSKKEVDQYLKYYASLDRRFAVVKIGGGCLQLPELDVLANSLAFLADVGLTPVILHGAGPQLNDELRSAGIVSDYIGGMRITTAPILSIARSIFLRENAKLVRALESRGTRTRSIVSGVFEADFLDREKMQYVGQVTRVHSNLIHDALELGQVPILTCMGETSTGQLLNINADVAGVELAKALKPIKVVYISAKGGLYDKDNKLIPVIDLDTDFPVLMTEPWFKYGDRLKLKEIKTLLDQLPLSSSVAITDSQSLPKELFTHKGSGTLIRRSEKIHVRSSLNEVDVPRLQELIEDSFQGQLTPTNYLESTVAPALHRLYISESYRATAVITKDPTDPDAVPYLDKFAVSKLSQGEGTAQNLWNHITKDNPQLFWRSRTNNFINNWYFERAQGSMNVGPWIVFWYGFDSLDKIQKCINNAKSRPHTIDKSKHHHAPSAANGENGGPLSADPVPLKATI